MANESTIQCVDDDIELLNPQILFLNEIGNNIIEPIYDLDAI